MHQNIQWIRIKVCRPKNVSSTSAALVPRFVGSSCFHHVYHVDRDCSRGQEWRNGKVDDFPSWDKWMSAKCETWDWSCSWSRCNVEKIKQAPRVLLWSRLTKVKEMTLKVMCCSIRNPWRDLRMWEMRLCEECLWRIWLLHFEQFEVERCHNLEGTGRGSCNSPVCFDFFLRKTANDFAVSKLRTGLFFLKKAPAAPSLDRRGLIYSQSTKRVNYVLSGVEDSDTGVVHLVVTFQIRIFHSFSTVQTGDRIRHVGSSSGLIIIVVMTL